METKGKIMKDIVNTRQKEEKKYGVAYVRKKDTQKRYVGITQIIAEVQKKNEEVRPIH